VSKNGWLCVQQLMTYGGSGYFPTRLLRQNLDAGQQRRVPHAPQFRLPAYMVYPRDSDNATLKHALDGLRELARAEHTRPD
jgi:DNA-binding transcriptional LysR family regulator